VWDSLLWLFQEQGPAMPSDALIAVTLDVYVAIFGAIAIVIAGVLYFLHRKEVVQRNRHFAQFKAADLRMSPYKIGLVYKIVAETETEVTVVCVWDGKTALFSGTEITLSSDEVIPFDLTRFS
jgi:hypothetical protein